jgi:hypothetical protein
MIISESLFELIISIALVITCVSPIVLIYFWLKDWKDRNLW